MTEKLTEPELNNEILEAVDKITKFVTDSRDAGLYVFESGSMSVLNPSDCFEFDPWYCTTISAKNLDEEIYAYGTVEMWIREQISKAQDEAVSFYKHRNDW